MSDHWKSLADLLGAPGLAATPKPAAGPATSSSAVPAEATPTLEQAPPARSAVKLPDPVVAAEPVKAKKRSSWETLANLFGIESKKEPEAEPAPPVPPAAVVAVSPTPPEISLFKPAEASNSNPALTEMFGQTSPTPHEQWGKPRKMVDDLGWDDDVPPPPRTSVRSEVSPLIDESESGEVDAADGAEPLRRSRRRRRRRGRGGRDEAGERVVGRDFESETSLPKDDYEDDVEELSGIDDVWGTSPVVSNQDVDPVLEEDIGEDSERRPRRRRRPRGRGRGERGERVEPEVLRPARLDSEDSDVDSVNRDLLNDYDDEEASPDAIYDELPTEASSADAENVRRRRRRKRNRGGKPVSSEADVSQHEDDDVDEQLEVELDVDSEAADEEGSGHKHRSIPTWEDSLVSIIDANIENHRRNEGRGGGYRGGGGGGRNRGRK